MLTNPIMWDTKKTDSWVFWTRVWTMKTRKNSKM